MDNFGNQMTNVNGQVVAQPAQQPAQAAQTVVQQQPVVMQQPVQNVQAMFTQEQLNSIISGRINPLNQKINDLNTQLAQAQQLSQSYLNELTCYKNREAATKAGVPAQFVDFAVFEASKLAVNGKSFDDAIKEYVSANGQLFGLSNQSAQGNQVTTPSNQTPTGVVATPQQSANAQQVQQTPTTIAQPAQTVQQTQQTQPAQQVQLGSSGIQTAGNPAVSNVDSEVDAFLKARGLKK